MDAETEWPSLSTDEENIIRYVAGYVPLKIMKNYEKLSSKTAAECTECLMGMAVNGDDSSLNAYTAEWTKLVNRGGLFEINDLCFELFREVEVQIKLMEMLGDVSNISTERRKSIIIDAVATNEDVQFFWAMLSCDITNEEAAQQLLKELVGLWLTIRGFSIAAVWIEQYKTTSSTNTSKKRGLRKELKQV